MSCVHGVSLRAAVFEMAAAEHMRLNDHSFLLRISVPPYDSLVLRLNAPIHVTQAGGRAAVQQFVPTLHRLD